MTYRELIDRAVFVAASSNAQAAVAGGAGGLTASAEALFLQASYAVARRYASSPARRAATNTATPLSFTAGSAALPPGPLTAFFDGASLGQDLRYVPNYADFLRPLDPALGYFALRTSREVVATLPGGAVATGSLTLIAPSAVQVPTLEGDALVAAPEILEEIITVIALALAGNLTPLASAPSLLQPTGEQS